jgi:5'-methylthioadenosine phosphorylase
MSQEAEIGIFGGSGFYEFADSGVDEIKVETPYGPPSDKLALCTIAGRKVVFLPRHGKSHSIPPHKINYRANLWAFKELGVTRIIAPNAVGSLQREYEPGHFAINDQFVDRTNGRIDTFYDGPFATHVSTAEPYCPQLRAAAIAATKAENVPVHETATSVVIQGPRFGTKAESIWHASSGFHIVSMTQYPEVTLARELAICFANISLITDYDSGVAVDGDHVESSDVLRVFAQNTENLKKVLRRVIGELAVERTCSCGDALKYARL